MKLAVGDAEAGSGEVSPNLPRWQIDGGGRVLGGGVVAFLTLAAWRWSGFRVADRPWFDVAALCLLLCLVCISGAAFWARDVWFWSGLLFLGFLGLQGWNAGRILEFDATTRQWGYLPPPHPGLPWSFVRAEAVQMLDWFLPAWVLGLVLRSPRLSRPTVKWVLRATSTGAGLLALFGVVQYLSGTDRMYWRRPFPDGFFATFPYTNHAAAYFLLMAAVSAGLAFHALFRPAAPAIRKDSILPCISTFLCLAGANLSLSRAGVVLSWGLVVLIAGFGLARGWRRLKPVARIHLAALLLAAGILLAILVAGLGGESIRSEFTPKRRLHHSLLPGVPEVNLELSDRPLLWSAAWQVFLDDPWFGAGGWGFGHLVAHHLSPEYWNYLRSVPGRANVHNDYLQFLAEFGLVGTGLMLAGLVSLAAPLFRRGGARGSVAVLSCAGLAGVCIFALIDLPFRCPAILWTWTAVLAALPRCAGPARTAPPPGSPKEAIPS